MRIKSCVIKSSHPCLLLPPHIFSSSLLSLLILFHLNYYILLHFILCFPYRNLSVWILIPYDTWLLILSYIWQKCGFLVFPSLLLLCLFQKIVTNKIGVSVRMRFKQKVMWRNKKTLFLNLKVLNQGELSTCRESYKRNLKNHMDVGMRHLWIYQIY